MSGGVGGGGELTLTQTLTPIPRVVSGRSGEYGGGELTLTSRRVVSGRVSLCRQVFGDALNDSRDPDRGGDDADPDRGGDDADRYSARYFLKHSFIERRVRHLPRVRRQFRK